LIRRETVEANESSLQYYGWRILAASLLGMVLSPGPLIFGSLGVVLASIQQEFGWGRAELMLSLSFFTFSSIVAAPIVGRLIDRFGAREILLPSVAILALTLVIIPFTLGSLTTFYAATSLAGFVSTGAQSISYVRVLSSWFEVKRGLAIGIAASGIGLGYMIMPLLVQTILSLSDWQTAYYVLAGLLILLPLPVLGATIRNEPQKLPQPGRVNHGANTVSTVALRGLSASEALRTKDFWLMTTGLTIMSMFLTGLVPHMVPLLKDGGLSASRAAIVASLMGLSTFFGRILAGYLLDKIFAPVVAICFFGVASLGLGLLSAFDSGPLVYVAAFMIGLGFGAESDLIGYLVGRYFGLKSFAQIYGYALAGFLFGAGVGPYLLGIGFEHWGSYTYILSLACGMSVLACVLFGFIGPYPDFSEPKTEDAGSGSAADDQCKA